MLRSRLAGLALEGLADEFGAELAADEDCQFFEAGEGGAPGWSFVAVEVGGQVFGRRSDHGAQFGRNVYLLGVFRHRQLLHSVARRAGGGLLRVTLRSTASPCKPCRTPPHRCLPEAALDAHASTVRIIDQAEVAEWQTR